MDINDLILILPLLTPHLVAADGCSTLTLVLIIRSCVTCEQSERSVWKFLPVKAEFFLPTVASLCITVGSFVCLNAAIAVICNYVKLN